MRLPSKIASILVAGVLGVGALTAVTMAVGDHGGWGDSAWAKSGEGMDKPHGKKCHRGKHGRHGADHLAKKLSIMETKIGIRANQLDAWRDFTDALQATMKRPMRPGPGMMAQDDNAEPFSLAEGFADNMIARAESAEELKTAIATLRTTLTAEQLETVTEIEARLRARMAKHHGWKHKGHPGKGPHKGPKSGPSPDEDKGDTL